MHGARGHDQEPAWQAWLAQRSENAWAWDQVQQTVGQFQRVPGPGAQALLQAQRGVQRRGMLKGFVLLAGASALGYGGWRQGREAGWYADLHSAFGQRLDTTLADGTRLQLNSDSAVDVLYDGRQRRLVLRRGEVLVSTAHDVLDRPFFVEVAQGTVQALGTRFSVRQRDAGAEVAVFEHRVRLTPASGQPLLLESGQQCVLGAQGTSAVTAVAPGQDAWGQGLLVANRQRLDDFLAELGRYRSGWLRCDPAVAGLRISGTFVLDDSDGALRALEASLPVRVVQRSRFWVTVMPR
ncbi:FecR domain-containing protein [Pseudomonas sp. 148P]|uniref:FecR domain-containing protein n=1 Tax=Pseudomonas ulcerans TaxID=3115852 RepID=A0ABU7HXT7_9PSED|nr:MULTISPECIES: FecR domain-containing protein [unclassified Pseudomonas]MEE1924763.1 FecR domain-containing protein [Pseudomonas sp. 147P]MEE1936385.1 FecR domain-containing protein [Pseudomonas sp. 148P]